MDIGETLAQARQRAGLSVAQVSEQTRIRETIIRDIEGDDYATCGGDFYARGHIRAIAKAVGTDSGPLIHEYDTLHRPPAALSAVSLEELQAISAQTPSRRRIDLPAVWARVAAACVSAWHRLDLPALWARAALAYRSSGHKLSSASVRGLVAAAAEPARRRVNLPALREVTAAAYASARSRVNWAAALALALMVVLGFGVYRFASGSPPPAASPSAASKHTVPGRPARHASPHPAPKISHEAVAPSPAAQTLTPVHAAAFGPGGGDNPQLAHLAIGGHHTAGWHTDWYTSARFGNLYPGTGLLLDMGRTVTITRVRINLGRVSGADFQLRVGTKPALTDLPAVAHVAGAGGVIRLQLARPAHGRYVLVWFTRLPADPAGTFEAGVHDISLEGHA